MQYRLRVPDERKFGICFGVYNLYELMDMALLWLPYPLMLANRAVVGFCGVNSATLRQAAVQTYLPDDPVIRAVAAHDRSIFTEHDAVQRLDACYPPYVRLTNVLVRGARADRVQAYIGALARRVGEGLDASCAALPESERPQILGPTACVIERAKDRFRHHFIIKTPLGFDVSSIVSRALSDIGSQQGISVSVDVDAYDLM